MEEKRQKEQTSFGLWKRWAKVFKKNSSSVCLRYRHRSKLQGRRSPYLSITYGEFYKRCVNFGYGLRDLLSSEAELNEKPFVPIMANNHLEWLLSAFGCFSEQFIVMVFQSSLSASEACTLLETGNCEAIICDSSALGRLLDEPSCLKYIILIDYELVTDEQIERSKEMGIKIESFTNIENRGKIMPTRIGVEQFQDHKDAVLVAYSSGTTGIPKGVIWTALSYLTIEFANFADCSSGIIISSITYSAVLRYSCMIFAQGGVLTMFMGEKSWMLGDIKDCAPKSLFAVPSFWKMLYNIHQRRVHDLGEEKAVKKTGKSLGPNIRMIRSGGAAMSPDVTQFLHECFPNCKVMNLYGSSEAGTCLANGKIISKREMKLVDAEEIGYTVMDNPYPRGELWIRGPGVATSYFRRPEETAEKFKDGGWLATGDIFEHDTKEDTYKVIDRKSSLFKLSTGVFISPEQLEVAYISLDILHQIWISGSINRPSLIAVVVLDKEAMENWGHKNEQDMDLKYYILNEFRNIASNRGFPEIEIPKAVLISKDPFSVNSGLTGTLKLHRKQLKGIYREELEDIYQNLDRETNDVKDLFWKVLGISQKEDIDEKELLSIAEADGRLDMTWSQVGGDSLAAMQFVTVLRQNFGVELPPDMLANQKYTLRDITEYVTSTSKTAISQLSDYQAAKLDLKFRITEKIQSLPPDSFNKPPKHIFLTGATGFLGIFLLEALLQHTDAVIHCLVRASSKQEAIERLEKSANANKIGEVDFDEEFDEKSSERSLAEKRVVVVVGDLALPLLGLQAEDYRSLCQRIGAIIHCGAYVNFLCDYKTARLANVIGTQTILNLASTHHVKQLHHISSISVLADAIQGGVFTKISEDIPLEKETLKDCCKFRFGYRASKWVGERLVRYARRDGLPIVIYRPGLMSANTNSGVSNPTDILNRLVMGMVTLGFGIDSSATVDMTPVDYAALAIVRIFCRSFGTPSESSSVAHLKAGTSKLSFHITNPKCLTYRQISDYIKSRGYELHLTSYENWRHKLLDNVADDPQHPLYPLAFQFVSPYPRKFARVSCKNTKIVSGLKYPMVTETYFHTFLDFLVDKNLIPPANPEKSHSAVSKRSWSFWKMKWKCNANPKKHDENICVRE